MNGQILHTKTQKLRKPDNHRLAFAKHLWLFCRQQKSGLFHLKFPNTFSVLYCCLARTNSIRHLIEFYYFELYISHLTLTIFPLSFLFLFLVKLPISLSRSLLAININILFSSFAQFSASFTANLIIFKAVKFSRN